VTGSRRETTMCASVQRDPDPLRCPWIPKIRCARLGSPSGVTRLLKESQVGSIILGKN
jgi:hypothetical protein